MNSEMRSDGFLPRLQQLIGDEKPYPWAGRIGLSQATFNRIWKEGVIPKGDSLLLIAEKTGVSIDWLLTGKGEMRRADAVIRNGQEVLIVEAKGQTRPARIDTTRNIQVKVYAMAGAGNACELEDLEPVDEVVIPLEFYRMSIIPVKVRGRSMETTIMDGAIVGIDSAETWVTSGDLYAVWLPYEGAVVKRIYMEADKVVCKSDNPNFSDIVVPLKQMSEHFVRGKVRWVIQQF